MAMTTVQPGAAPANTRPRAQAKAVLERHYPNPQHPNEVHPDDMPDVYASICKGVCLEPFYRDGACLVFSKSEQIEPGDFVGVLLHPAIVEADGLPRRVKRLVSAGWHGITFPFKPHPQDEVEPVVILEQLNPPRIFRIRASHILAMHKVIGEAETMGNGQARFRPAKKES